MKITQNQNQLIIKNGGAAKIVVATLFVIIGLVIVLAALAKDLKFYVTLVGIAFILIGVLSGFFAKSRRIILDKSGQSSVSNKRILGGGTATQTFATSSIVRIDLITRPAMATSGMNSNVMASPNRISTIKAILNDNSEIILGSGGQNSVSIGGISSALISKAPLTKQATQIADFLGVPLGTEDVSNPVAAVESVVNAFEHRQQNTPFNEGVPSATQQPTMPPNPTTPSNPSPLAPDAQSEPPETAESTVKNL